MYIVSESSITNAIQDELPDLQQKISDQLDYRIRRIDRYIQLCILGAMNCVLHKPIPQNSSMVIATGNGTASTAINIMETVFIHHRSPKPLHFVNSLGNSACHFLSKILNIQGNSLVLSQGCFSFESALTHAYVDLTTATASTILIGGIDEAPLPIAHQKLRLSLDKDITHIYEGSYWLAISHKADSTADINIRISTPAHFGSFDEIIKAYKDIEHREMSRAVYFNYIPSQVELTQLDLQKTSIYHPEPNHHPHPVYSGKNIVDAVQKIRRKIMKAATIISYDKDYERYCLTHLYCD